MSLAPYLAAALERCHGLCLDVAEERAVILDALLAAVAQSPDAQLIRREFFSAYDGPTRLVVSRGLGGKREAALLTAAARLAGCGEPAETPPIVATSAPASGQRPRPVIRYVESKR